MNFDEIFEDGKHAAEFDGLLGKFVLIWADTERAIFDVLVYYAGVNRKVGRALFSGSRAKTMLDFIAAIHANVGTPEKRAKDIGFLASQITAINSLRDKLVHHGSLLIRVSPAPGKRLLYNKHRAMRESASFEITIDNGTLISAINDLYRIYASLQMHLQEPFRPHPGSGDVTTWRYRSPQPAQKKRPPLEGRSAHPPRPQSSRPKSKPPKDD